MKKILSIVGVCVILNACSGLNENNSTLISSTANNNFKIIALHTFVSNCKDNLLYEYLPWFKKSQSEIESLQKEYGISYKIPTITIKNKFSNLSLLLSNNRFIEKIRTSIECQKGNIDKIVFYEDRLLFACILSQKHEFRYSVYFGQIKNSRLELKAIDNGGGEFE